MSIDPFEIIKTLGRIVEKVKDAETREAIVDARLALIDSKERIAELREQVAELRMQLSGQPGLAMRDEVLWAPEGSSIPGPFCPTCHGSEKGKQIPLVSDEPYAQWRCPICKTKYKKRPDSPGSGGIFVSVPIGR